ncbi:NTPase/helicase [Mythimna separata entomopoxvirus 'L']|uniref:NTPase/helicase n=1 Tax=Mythimna separata entomopoxvirus 'L' TaxID=1293572 RepID=A0A916KQB7_9POXV|nr:NTPase/helicase [Mythimna separata entomopoxvirus 'L']CCU56295.1 NTPase/helicase [Mythimna separata entomopoxvirus 'L']
MNCAICYDCDIEYKIFNCNNCKEYQCFDCTLKYKKFECCKCSNVISTNIINKIFKQYKNALKIYKLYYVNKKIRNKSVTELTVYDIIKKNKTLIRYGTQILMDKVNSLDTNNLLCFCPTYNCKAMILSNILICPFCEINVCEKCHEENNSNHICDEEILKNLELLKLSGKNCPKCHVFITKIDGCNDMICTNCSIFFNWRTLEITANTSNHHYNYIREYRDREYTYIFDIRNYIIKDFCNITINTNINKYREKIIEIECEYYNNKTNNNQLINKLYIIYKKLDYMVYIYNCINDNKNMNCDDLKIILDKYIDNNIICFPVFIIDSNDINKIFKKNINKPNINKNVKIIQDNNIKSIKLLNETQESHVNNIYNILLKYKSAFDYSLPGSGKTYISLYCAKKLNVKNLVVICPAILVKKWNTIIRTYNNYNKFNYLVISTNKLAIKKYEYPNDYLIRIECFNREEFTLNDYMTDMLNENSMLIIDESHTNRNVGLYMKGILALVYNSKGYIINISATPIENINQLENIIKKTGIIRNNTIINDLINYITTFSKDDIMKYYNNKVFNNGYIRFIHYKDENKFIEKNNLLYSHLKNINLDRNFMLDIMHRVYFENIQFITTIIFANIKYQSEYINTLTNYKMYLVNYKYNDEENLAIQNAYTLIDIKNPENTLEITNILIKGLMQIETATINKIYEISSHILDNTDNSKIVIAMNYNDVINDIYNLIYKKYKNIRVITGKTTNKHKIIEKFQEDNTNIRILLVNPNSINVGIDLDDKYGTYKRFVIFCPNITTINLYQFIYRFIRLDSKSFPMIHIINANYKIINNFKNKIDSQKELFNNKITLINDIPEWDENSENIQKIIEYINN